MREERIMIHPFEELKIEEYHGLQQINEHAYVRLAGLIPFEKKDEYMQLGTSQTWVQVAAVTPEEGENALLCGVVEKMRLEVKGGTCRMELPLRSGTVLMDSQKKIRSFQSFGIPYSRILDICEPQYNDAGKDMTTAKEKETNRFIMQYQETDWNFIKRLASINHTVVMADWKGPIDHGATRKNMKTTTIIKHHTDINTEAQGIFK